MASILKFTSLKIFNKRCSLYLFKHLKQIDISLCLLSIFQEMDAWNKVICSYLREDFL